MLVAAMAVVVGAALQSATAFGFALVVSPVLVAVLPPEEALLTLFGLAAVLCTLVLFSERRRQEVRGRELAVISTAAIPGALAGALVLRVISQPALQVMVGLAVLAAGLFQLRQQVRGQALLHRPPPWATAGIGLTTGVLTTTTGVNGPPLVLWFQARGATPGQLRDTMAAAFLVLDVLGIAILGLLGQWRVDELSAAFVIVLVAATAAGQLLGRVLFHRLDPNRFRAAGLALVLIAGTASVVAGVAG